MAIQFEDLIIDRPLQGIFENSLGDIIGGVNQLQNVSIETTSETKDKTDAVGALIMRFFTSKSVEISAENAVFSTSLAALQFGQDKEIASNSNKILMPRIFTINTDTIALTGTNKEYQLPDVPAGGVVHINGLTNTGVPDPNKKYKMHLKQNLRFQKRSLLFRLILQVKFKLSMIEKLKAVSSLLKLLTSSLRHVSLLFRFLLQTLATRKRFVTLILCSLHSKCHQIIQSA